VISYPIPYCPHYNPPNPLFKRGFKVSPQQRLWGIEKLIKDPEASKLPDVRTSGLIPILGIPACGMYSKTTVFDLVLPRLLAGERISRRELAELGHGGLCRKCEVCSYPVCPFGKG
jgi:hypothetical protein